MTQIKVIIATEFIEEVMGDSAYYEYLECEFPQNVVQEENSCYYYEDRDSQN